MAGSGTSVPVLLTGVTSVTHLLYAASWLRSRLARGEHIDLVVADPGSFVGRARVTPADLETFLPRDEGLTVSHGGRTAYTASGATPSTLLSVGAPGLKAFADLTRRRGRRPLVVVVDEGIGSYGDRRTRLAAYRRAGGGGPWPIVRAAAVAAGHRVLTGERWSTYRRRPGGRRWEVNADVAAEFARHRTGERAPAGTAVYLTQPWVALGVMDPEDYVEHLREVEVACALAGRHLVVVPHPADDAGSYAGFDVRTPDRPVELDRFVTTADVVIGSDSTALLNLAAFDAVPAVRVTMPATAPLEAALGEDQRDLLDHFLPPAVPTSVLADSLATVIADAEGPVAPD